MQIMQRIKKKLKYLIWLKFAYASLKKAAPSNNKI